MGLKKGKGKGKGKKKESEEEEMVVKRIDPWKSNQSSRGCFEKRYSKEGRGGGCRGMGNKRKGVGKRCGM